MQDVLALFTASTPYGSMGLGHCGKCGHPTAGMRTSLAGEIVVADEEADDDSDEDAG